MGKLLYIGRFQPLHFGHLSVITAYHNLVIGIGSSQYERTVDNPLSASERRWCLEQVTAAPIIEIPDIHDDAHWVDHALRIVYSVLPSTEDLVEGIVTGNAHVARLCAASGLTVIPIQPTIDINATALRSFIRLHNPIWRSYVPPAIHNLIEPIILNTGSLSVEEKT